MAMNVCRVTLLATHSSTMTTIMGKIEQIWEVSCVKQSRLPMKSQRHSPIAKPLFRPPIVTASSAVNNLPIGQYTLFKPFSWWERGSSAGKVSW